MRKFLISTALVASTLAVAAPAAAQWAPPVPQGYAYGYNNNGQVRRLEVRVQQIRREIQQLDRRNILSNREARRLDSEARNLQMRVRQLGYNGLNSRERYEIERQITRLEYRIRREANDGNRYGYDDYNGYGNNGYGNNQYGYNQNSQWDRDRDGRDDRYEDDRGREHDHGDRDDD